MALVNVKKKVEKKADALGIEERIVAACTTNPSGTMNRMLAKELGGVVGGAVAGRGQSTEPATGGLAQSFPDGRHFLVLTEHRLLLTDVSTMTGSPKRIVAEWPRTEITAIEAEKGRLAEALTITFDDGSAVQVEGAKGTDPGGLVAAFAD